jgi:hypothetical protein
LKFLYDHFGEPLLTPEERKIFDDNPFYGHHGLCTPLKIPAYKCWLCERFRKEYGEVE